MPTVTIKALINFQYGARSLLAGRYYDQVEATDALTLARQGRVSLTLPGRDERVSIATAADAPQRDRVPSPADVPGSPAAVAVVNGQDLDAGSPPPRRRGRRRGAYQRRDLVPEPPIE